MTTFCIALERSEALATSFKTDVARVEFDVEDDWLQFTYEALRTPDGGFGPLNFGEGCWWHDGAPYSDLILSVREGT